MKLLTSVVRILFVAPVLFSVPASAALLICTAGVVSVPILNPASTSAAAGDLKVTCTAGGDLAATADVEIFLNVNGLSGMPILTDGTTNYPSMLVSENEVVFESVRFSSLSGVTLELENLFVNPSLLPPGAEFVETISPSPAQFAPISNESQVVAINANVPEPSTLLLLACGLAALYAFKARRATGRSFFV